MAEKETEISIADQILHRLFTNGAGQQADRLLLVKDELHRYAATVSNAQYLGGYSRDAVRVILQDVLSPSDAEQLMELRRVAEAARDFVYEPENWEAYQDSKESNSVAWPPEFLLLAQAVEKKYGPMPTDDDDDDDDPANPKHPGKETQGK